MDNTQLTPTPAATTLAPQIPIAHQSHPFWTFLGNFSLAFLHFAAVAAPPAVAVLTKNPALAQEVQLGGAAVDAGLQAVEQSRQ